LGASLRRVSDELPAEFSAAHTADYHIFDRFGFPNERAGFGHRGSHFVEFENRLIREFLSSVDVCCR